MGVKVAEWRSIRCSDLIIKSFMDMVDNPVYPSKIKFEISLESEPGEIKALEVEEVGKTVNFDLKFNNRASLRGHFETWVSDGDRKTGRFRIWGVFNFGSICFNEAVYDSFSSGVGVTDTEKEEIYPDSLTDNDKTGTEDICSEVCEEVSVPVVTTSGYEELLSFLIPVDSSGYVKNQIFIELSHLLSSDSVLVRGEDGNPPDTEYIKDLPEVNYPVTDSVKELKSPFDRLFSAYENLISFSEKSGSAADNDIVATVRTLKEDVNTESEEYKKALSFYAENYIFSAFKGRITSLITLGKVLLIAWLIEKECSDEELISTFFRGMFLLPGEIAVKLPENIESCRVSGLVSMEHKFHSYKRGDLAAVENLVAGERLVLTRSTGESTSEALFESAGSVEEESDVLDSDLKKIVESSQVSGQLDSIKTSYDNFKSNYGPPVTVTMDGSCIASREIEAPGKKDGESFARTIVEKSLRKAGKIQKEARRRVLGSWKRRGSTRVIDNRKSEDRSTSYYWIDKIYKVRNRFLGRRLVIDLVISKPFDELKKSLRSLLTDGVPGGNGWENMPEGVSDLTIALMPEKTETIYETILPGELKRIKAPEGYAFKEAELKCCSADSEGTLKGTLGGDSFSLANGTSVKVQLETAAEVPVYVVPEEDRADSAVSVSFRAEMTGSLFFEELKRSIAENSLRSLMEKCIIGKTGRDDLKEFLMDKIRESFRKDSSRTISEFMNCSIDWSAVELTLFDEKAFPVSEASVVSAIRTVESVRISLPVYRGVTADFLFYIKTGTLCRGSGRFIPVVSDDRDTIQLLEAQTVEDEANEEWEASVPTRLIKIDGGNREVEHAS